MKQLILLVIISVIVFFNCNPADPSINSNMLKIAVEDISCTEAWIRITAENLQLPLEINLSATDPVGNTNSKSSMLNTPDSLLYIDSLLPNKNYTFQALISKAGEVIIGSGKVTAATMDTTSHNFTWQTFTFGGEAGSSYLNDVAIIDENNIYVVGAIYLKDSLGNPDPEQYAVAHWNGNEWELMKLKYNCRLYYPNCGPETMLIVSASSVFARNKNDIWIAAGSVHHFDGTKWTQEAGILGAGTANKIWGNENELWFVGNNGFIAHRDKDGTWQKIESGTELNINDIYGAFNEKTNEYKILAVASNVLESFEKEIIKIKKNGTTELLSKKGINSTLSGVWFKPNIKYYVVGAGIHFKEMLNNPKWKSYLPGEVSSYYSYGIKANGLNDIAVAGGVGEVLHFNGVSWKSYFAQTKLGYGNYYSLVIKNNIIIAVGQDSPQAAITIGRRN